MSVVLHPRLKGARACIFDAGGTIVHAGGLLVARAGVGTPFGTGNVTINPGAGVRIAGPLANTDQS